MKRQLTTVATLVSFGLLLTTSNAMAQADLSQPIAAARSAYTQDEPNNTLAQMPGQRDTVGRQGPPVRGPVYQGSEGQPPWGQQSWGPQFSPGHTLIGAAIGFGFGAFVGSRGGVRASLGVGAIVGLVGAGIGAGIPSFPSHYHRRWWDDEEALRRKQKRSPREVSPPDSATQVAAATPDPANTAAETCHKE